jgi:hypothetical protein
MSGIEDLTSFHPGNIRKTTIMPTSEAQKIANRKNAQLSTGPKTEEGKSRSRRNALKHGLTGEGVALPDEDAAEVASRFEELEAELQPSGFASRLWLRRFAYLSVRLERCERLDTAVYSKRIRHADEDFVDARMTRVEELACQMSSNPLTVARRLQLTPEGIDLLIANWEELRGDLMNHERNTWTMNHQQRMERLLGHPEGSYRQTRSHALTEALSGFFYNINPSEIVGDDDLSKMQWAQRELAKIIDNEIQRLLGVRDNLNPAIIEQDRLEAADRCLFDLQHGMNQVRKYEAATERGMYKALNEFRAVEATLKANGTADENARKDAELASFEPEKADEEELAETVAYTAPERPTRITEIPETIHFPAKRSLDDAPNFFGKQESGES